MAHQGKKMGARPRRSPRPRLPCRNFDIYLQAVIKNFPPKAGSFLCRLGCITAFTQKTLKLFRGVFREKLRFATKTSSLVLFHVFDP